jgi:hypothetical protein
MTSAEFNRAEIEWADNLLSQAVYTMPNGKSSHQVAYEVKSKALDRMISENRLAADGRWV